MLSLNTRLFLLTVVMLSGCTMPAANYEDVSKEAPYKRLIGKRFRTLTHLQIRGITDAEAFRPPIDYYFITGTPSIGGPEVLERSSLVAGSVLEVTRILRCTNCPLDDDLHVQVTISSDQLHEGTPVYVVDVGNLLDKDVDKNVTLNSEFFEPEPSALR